MMESIHAVLPTNMRLIVLRRRHRFWASRHRRQPQKAARTEDAFGLLELLLVRRIRFEAVKGRQRSCIPVFAAEMVEEPTGTSRSRGGTAIRSGPQTVLILRVVSARQLLAMFFRSVDPTGFAGWAVLRRRRRLSHCDLCGWCRQKAAAEERKNHRLKPL